LHCAQTDVHEVPELASPAQNISMGKELHQEYIHSKSIKLIKESECHKDQTLASRLATFFRACSRPLSAQNLRSKILVIVSMVLLGVGISPEEGKSNP
jgi:hypothetical protein